MLFKLFIAFNLYDLVVTSSARLTLQGFVEYNPVYNVFVHDPIMFVTAMILFKILAVLIVVGFVVWINNMHIEFDGNRIYGTPVVLVVTLVSAALCIVLTYNMVVALLFNN